MIQYRVFFMTSKNTISPNGVVVYANSPEDAKIKADVDLDLIYDVIELDKWTKFNDDRRGYYLGKDLPKIRTKKCWAKDFFKQKQPK